VGAFDDVEESGTANRTATTTRDKQHQALKQHRVKNNKHDYPHPPPWSATLSWWWG